jgi:hypothetical protein
LDYIINNVKLYILENSFLKIENHSQELVHIHFKNPKDGYSFYANHDFGPKTWCIVDPTQANFDFIYIELLYENKVSLIKYHIKEKHFEDISTPLVKCSNFDIIPNTTTFLIAAYKAQDFILETIFSIKKLETRYQKIEILIGIDNCFHTTKKLIESKLPDNLKIYFFEENVGPYPIFNTLAEKAKGSSIIFFGADDIAMPNLLEVFNKNIIEYDMVRFGCYSFQDGDDYLLEENLKLHPVIVGGCKGIKKSTFLKLNGYLKWRASADDEFGRRAISQNVSYIDPIEEPTFLYRQHPNSISANQSTNLKSVLRASYRGILTDRINSNQFPNPDKLYTENPIKIH